MSQMKPITLVDHVDGRSDLVLDDHGAQVALHSITFEAVNGGAVTLGFGNDGLSRLIEVLQTLLVGTLEHQLVSEVAADDEGDA